MKPLGKKDVDAEKLFVKDSKKKRRDRMVFAVVMIFVLFFTSNFWMPTRLTKASSLMKVGDTEEFANERTVMLLAAEYSKEQDLLEVVVEFTNKSYDNVDEYYYAADISGIVDKTVPVSEIYNEQLVTVLRVENVKQFAEVELIFAPKYDSEKEISDNDTGTIILNKNNVDFVSHIDTQRDISSYLTLRLDVIIARLEKDLDDKTASVAALENEIDAIEKESASLEENKKYLTEEEIITSEEAIENNKQVVLQRKAEIETLKGEIASLEEQITDAKAKREALK